MKISRKRLIYGLIFGFLISLMVCAAGQAAVENAKNIQTYTGGRFVQKNGDWYYKQENGKYLKDILGRINGKIYYFSPKGVRLYGFQPIGKNTYYFGKKDEGFMYRDAWYYKSAKAVYYLQKNGRLPRNKWLTIGDHRYYFNKQGRRVYGFKTIKGKKYYFGESDEGYLYINNFFLYKKHYYYSKDDGEIATGRIELNGNVYYFHDNGTAYTGTVKIDGCKCYFNDLGQLLYKCRNLNITSQSAILMRVSNGKMVYGKNEDVKRPGAATSNIMTAMIAMEKGDLTDSVTFSSKAANMPAPKLYCGAGETASLEDLLYSLLLGSHNDTAIALAEHISGTEAAFVKLMNKKAIALGCTDTKYVTASGADSTAEQYTTASDLARITAYACNDSAFRKIVKSTAHTFTSGSGDEYTILTNNQLLSRGVNGVIGVTGGSTINAGSCYVGLVKTNKGQLYVSVVLGSDTSAECWADTETLLTYAYNNY